MTALSLSCVLLTGCSKEKTNEPGGGFTGETITVPVTLTPEFMGGVTVKSAGTGIQTSGDDARQTAPLSQAASSSAGTFTPRNSPYDPRSLMSVSAYTGPEAVAMAEGANRTIAYGDFKTSVATRSQTGVDESLVSDVWFVQLNAAGTAALQPPVYLSAGQLAETRLSLELVGEQSMIYFLANSHDPALMSPNAALSSFTQSTVEALSKTYAAATIENDLTSQGMPMAGRWTGIPSGDVIAVPLKRALAKVTINLSAQLPSGHSFSPKLIQICRVPATLNLYRDAATAPTPYPASLGAGAVAFTDYAREDISSESITATPTSFVYYLPENARGTGTGTTQMQKTADFAPGASAAEGPFCTHVQIIGYYNNGNGAELTKYTVYLGADNTSDYNLKRNNAYGVDITLKGGNPSYDARITLMPIPIESSEADKTKITLPFTAKVNGQFTVTDVSGLQWTVTSADPSWLKIATTATGTSAADFQLGIGTQTYYAYVPSENQANARTADIIVSRFGVPEGRITVNQKPNPVPPMHTGWAGCNIYWDGSRLTFDDVGVTTNEDYQGVYFKWGSLVAISPTTLGYSPSTSIVYSPDGRTSFSWDDIPTINVSTLTCGKDINALKLIHDPAALTGDICKYITDLGWSPSGKWRMPTYNEGNVLITTGSWVTVAPQVTPTPNAPDGTTRIPFRMVDKKNNFQFAASGYLWDQGRYIDWQGLLHLASVHDPASGHDVSKIKLCCALMGSPNGHTGVVEMDSATPYQPTVGKRTGTVRCVRE